MQPHVICVSSNEEFQQVAAFLFQQYECVEHEPGRLLMTMSQYQWCTFAFQVLLSLLALDVVRALQINGPPAARDIPKGTKSIEVRLIEA